jgi:hypothetical protein
MPVSGWLLRLVRLSDANILCELSKQLTNEETCAKRRIAEITAPKLKPTLPENVASGIVAEHLNGFRRGQIFTRAMIVLGNAALLVLKLKSCRSGEYLHVDLRVATKNCESLALFLVRERCDDFSNGLGSGFERLLEMW